MFTKTEHILDCKINASKHKIIKILQSIIH